MKHASESYRLNPDLLPAKEDREEFVEIAVIDEMIASANSARFKEDCESFRSEFLDGDVVVAFCTNEDSWRVGMGMAGYLLRRCGENVHRIITRMN